MMLAGHKYLQSKRLTMQGCLGLRVDKQGWLVVPMWRDGQIVSIQRISETGKKLFTAGAPTKRACYWIERPRAAVTVLCEGIATGLTLAEALPASRVCVCFSAANLISVAQHEDWHGLTVVAGDNDHWTAENTGKNPGLEAAEKAAELIGCRVAIPFCEETDFNDLFCERLAKLEEAEEFARVPTPPHKLRAAALAPIAAELLKAAKMVP